MNARRLAIALSMALGTSLPQPGMAEDLLQVYRDALQNDPVLAGARASWTATQERIPQAEAGLLPNVTLSAVANANNVKTDVRAEPRVVFNRNYETAAYTISAAHPLFRLQNKVALDQAREQVNQSDYVLAAAQQDLIVRVAQAYFDVLLAQFNVELTESQRAAVSEQLAQAKRNFEVGVSTITDTNEAQARYDTIVAQGIAAANDLDNRRTALRVIIGRAPTDLRRLGPGFDPVLPQPNTLDHWVDRALKDNYSVRVARSTFEVATLEVERQRAGNTPTFDIVGSFNQNMATGLNSTASFGGANNRNRIGVIGLQMAMPLYQGGIVDSRVREALSQQERARQDLETTRRNALSLAQTGFNGVTSAAASIKAFEQALVSAQTAYESNQLGLEVGVRTTLDVLNVQQTLFQTRRDLAQAYFNYLLGTLRLKAAVGSLTEEDLAEINRRLSG